jgi:outer membrane receptor for ferrienterochelin and colicin
MSTLKLRRGLSLRFAAAWLLLFALGFANPGVAQEQSGAIQGIVKDSQGGVLPGVTVEARSSRNVGVQTAVTDTAGVFRFPALPAGAYEFTATLQGFGPAKSSATVSLGQILKVDLTLPVGSMTETVQVVGEAPLIDVKANAATATVGRETIDMIPKGRGFLSVLTQIPGTNNETRGGGLMIDGASGSENRFLVDGVDRTNARTGTAMSTTNTATNADVVVQDFVETVQVKQSGYNAEFRAALGGVVSAVTRSGTNSFHGSAGTYYTNNKYLGDLRPTLRQVPTNLALAEQIKPPRDKGHAIDPVLSLSGPILKDKVWFFAGYNPQSSFAERTVRWVTPGTNPGTQTFDNGSPTDKTLTYNLTSQITNKLRARVTGSNQRQKGPLGLPAIEQDGSSTANATSFNPRPSVRTDSFTDSYSGVIDYVASTKLYLNTTVGYFGYGSFSNGGDYYHGTRRVFQTTNTNLLDVPTSLQRVSGFADNPSNSFSVQDDYSRLNVSTDATWFARWKGDHSVKVGGLYERIGNQANLGQQAPNINFFWGSTYSTLSNTSRTGRYGYFTAFRQYTGGDIKETNLSFFVQDQWTVNNKVTVNYGLRLENEEIPSYKPENPGVKFGWGDKIAPRLGFAYDLKGDSQWKAYGSWGVFYDTMKLEMPRGAWGGDHWIDYVYTLDTPDWTSVECKDINASTTCTGGTFIEQNDRRHPSNELGKSLVDPNLKPTKKQEFTVGMDHELSSVMSIGIRYAHKWWNETIDDVGVSVPGLGEVFYIANPGSGLGKSPLGSQFPSVPKVSNSYDGVELVLRKRYSNRWQATSSLLWSRLYGNYGGLASSDEAGRTSPNVSRYYDALYLSFDQKGKETNGLLNTDRPLQFKLQGSYSLPFGTNVGVNFIAMSGTLNSSTVTYASVPVYYKGRGDLGRTPTLTQTDLVLTHSIKIKGGARLGLEANISNVFDQDTVTQIAFAAYRDALTIPGFTNNPGGAFFQPGGFDTDAIQAARFAAGNGTTGRPDPRYKLPNAYQGARAVRVLARISF